jgi:signal peptidase II
MKDFFTKGRIALIVINRTLIIDQIIKILVKTHMYLHDSISITILVLYLFYREQRYGIWYGIVWETIPHDVPYCCRCRQSDGI